MLSLDSNLWGKLRGPYGSSENVPQLIRQLQREYSQPVKDELYFEELFHQSSVYSSTLAATPYLVEIARHSTDPEARLDIFITCGLFEANRSEGGNNGDALPSELAPLIEQGELAVSADIYSSYLAAIQELGGYTAEVMQYAAASGKDDTEKRYVIAADAAFRGSIATASVLATFSEGDEYVATCLSCNEEIYLWPTDDGAGLVAYREDPVFHTEQHAHKATPAEPITDPELALLQQQSALIEESKLIRHLPYLAGHALCPSCGDSTPIWPGLTAMYG